MAIFDFSLTGRVMRRVYLIWWARQIVGLTGARWLVLAAALGICFYRVSWFDVFKNARSVGWQSQYSFWQGAFGEAEMLLWVAAGFSLIISGWFFLDWFLGGRRHLRANFAH